MNCIPEPVPVKSDIEISAFYYPGTEQMAEWDQVEQTLPHIKPLLGWYDESDPEVIDWQIKWAVEHGISSFCLDWYWNKADQRLDHWIRGFYRARYRKYLKWYVMWANHNNVGAHSEEDQRNVTRFWIENYFRTPEYYTVEGHPAVVIWSMHNIDNDFRKEAEKRGEILKEGEGIKRALEISNEEMHKAGLPDIYFICMYQSSEYSAELLENARKAGFREMMNYNILAQTLSLASEEIKKEKEPGKIKFDHVLPSSLKWWEMTADRELDFFIHPILSTGWDDRPRSFEKGRVLYARTAEKFRKLCLSCKEFCEKNGRKKVILAPLNEWQEGSYIEPNEEFGFSMYDALRDVFCQKPAEGFPPDLTPGDVGLGPYDYPPMEHPDKTSWDFSKDVQGWYRQPFGTAYLRIQDQALHFFRSGGPHAAIRTRIKEFPAEKFSLFKVMMKVVPPDMNNLQPEEKHCVRLYFGTAERPLFSPDLHICHEGAVSTEAVPDGKWHEYTLDISSNPLWKGMVNELWFDPPQKYSMSIDIKWMKFLP